MQQFRSRVLNIIAAAESVREAHAELRRPLSPAALKRIFLREGVDVRRAHVPKARVYGFDGTFTIILPQRLPARDAWKHALHEWAHAKLHFVERGEVVWNRVPCRRGDVREDEANLFALLLILGPEATPDTPRVAQLVAKIEARAYRRRAPQRAVQLPLDDYVLAPPPAEPPPAHVLERPGKEKRPRRRGWKNNLMVIGDPPAAVTHDAMRCDWSRQGKPLRWFHKDLGWIDVYDLMAIERGGRRRIVTLTVGDGRAQKRVFVLSSSDRRRYTFQTGETHGRTARVLDEQFEWAKKSASRTAGDRRMMRTRDAAS